jgi:predicted nucleic acid-binding protein
MEYLNNHLKKGNTESMVDAFLDQMNITVVPFGKDEAIQAAKNSFKNWNSNEDTREYAIGSTELNLGAKLVTNNLKDFKWMENVITPEEILEKY